MPPERNHIIYLLFREENHRSLCRYKFSIAFRNVDTYTQYLRCHHPAHLHAQPHPSVEKKQNKNTSTTLSAPSRLPGYPIFFYKNGKEKERKKFSLVFLNNGLIPSIAQVDTGPFYEAAFPNFLLHRAWDPLSSRFKKASKSKSRSQLCRRGWLPSIKEPPPPLVGTDLPMTKSPSMCL